MREIRRIFLHCSATKPGQKVSRETLLAWHKERGWKDIGYHYVVNADGSYYSGRPEAEPGAHAVGHNADSLAICYIGGLGADGQPADTRTAKQIKTTDSLIDDIRLRHGHGIEVWGHNEVSSKACPSFDVTEDRRRRRR